MVGEAVEDVLDGGREGFMGLGGEAGGGEVGGGEPDALGVGAGGIEVDLGSEVLVADLSGFEGFEFDVVRVRFAVNVEHEVYGVSEVGGSAVDAGLVGVVDKNNGGVFLVGDVPEGLEMGVEGEEGVLVCPGDDADEGVDDEDIGTCIGDEFLEGVDVFFEAEVEVLHRGEVEGDIFWGVVGAHDLGEAVGEAVLADLFVNPEDMGEAGLAIQPGFSHG